MDFDDDRMKSEDVKGGKPTVTVMIADPLHYRFAWLLLILNETHGAATRRKCHARVTFGHDTVVHSFEMGTFPLPRSLFTLLRAPRDKLARLPQINWTDYSTPSRLAELLPPAICPYPLSLVSSLFISAARRPTDQLRKF